MSGAGAPSAGAAPGRLALDLGGVHGALSLDVFHAERHTNESNFRIETTIDCLVGGIN